MEYFGSRGDEAVPACKTEISNSDVLIGVYAWRYGWQKTKSHPSITEEEFDYARLLGKRCLCYVIDPEHPWPPKHVDRGEAADLLERFKGKVDELVRSKFTTPENLAAQVAADLAREMTTRTSVSNPGGLLMVELQTLTATINDLLLRLQRQGDISKISETEPDKQGYRFIDQRSKSKFLSLILRHKPSAAALKVDDQGWADVGTLISGTNAAGYRLSLEELEEVVRCSHGKLGEPRFTISPDGRRIRANWGHSIAVSDLRT
jgi:hypothetical protein